MKKVYPNSFSYFHIYCIHKHLLLSLPPSDLTSARMIHLCVHFMSVFHERRKNNTDKLLLSTSLM